MNTDTASPKVHHGRNVKRLREILGVKQEVLAHKLDLSQQMVSKLENKEIIDENTLSEIAKVLHIPVESIKNFNDEATFNFVANNFHDTSIGVNSNCTITFNPIEKIVELYNEKQDLYERMILEKNELIEKLLNK